MEEQQAKELELKRREEMMKKKEEDLKQREREALAQEKAKKEGTGEGNQVVPTMIDTHSLDGRWKQCY